METYQIKTSAELKSAIAELEIKNKAQWLEIKQEANDLYEKVAPVGRAVVAVSQLFSKPELKENMFNTALSNLLDFLTKRLIVKGSENRFKIILANAVKYGILRFFAQKQDVIQSTFSEIKDKLNGSAFTHIKNFIQHKFKRMKRSFG